jgi:site-specific DNA recombinase
MRAVIYTRVSTDEQRQASHDDQARNCERVIAREGWNLLRRYTDHGFSGASRVRPEYQRLLAAAEAKEFDVLLIDDLSRFSRDLIEAEKTARRFGLYGIRVLAPSDGYDSTSRNAKLHRGMKNLMNEAYRDDLIAKTHRGLEGRARSGLSVGGRAYGYKRGGEVRGPKGDLVGFAVLIDDKHAAVVRRIFEMYASGISPRAIAGALNAEGVPSPGATWKREDRRTDGKWLASAIYGDPKRGFGILNNDLYRGVRVWNRSRSSLDLDGAKRLFFRRPEEERVEVAVPNLRIVSDDLWSRVRARQATSSAHVGAKIRAGISRFAAAGSAGGVSRRRYLFSGLLKCRDCGASYVVSGQQQAYVCASFHNGRACKNTLTVQKTVVEERLLRDLRERLLAPEVFDAFKADVRELLRAKRRESVADRKARDAEIEKLRREVENLADAIASGALRGDERLAARYRAKSEELADKESALVVDDKAIQRVETMIPRVQETYRRLIDGLPKAKGADIAEARGALGDLVGGFIRLGPENGALVGEYSLSRETLVFQCLGRSGKRPDISDGSGGRI